MNDKDIKNLYDNLEAPVELQNKILSAMNDVPAQKTKTRKIPLKRFIMVSAAVMLSLTMLISAVAIVIHQTQYIPFKGFVDDGEYEVYYTPEILTLGKYATVETVTRVQKGKTSDLSIIITDTLSKDLKIITPNNKEFDLSPTTEYSYSSFGTLGKFQFDKEGDYSSYGYFIKDFPDINEFTLVNGSESVEVKLEPNNTGGVVTAEDSGVTMKFYSMAKGSKVLAYEMEDTNFNIMSDIMIENTNYKIMASKTVELGGLQTLKLYDEEGKQIALNGFDHSRGPDGVSTVMFLRIGREERISKISINKVRVDMNIFNREKDIPVPADGEEIVFDNGGLAVYDCDGLTGKIESVTRKGNDLTFYTKAEYNGESVENVENMCINLAAEWDKLKRGTMSGWGYDIFKYENLEDSVKIQMAGLKYEVNGNWEIDFE